MEYNSLKILWVKSGPLHPINTGGKIRTYNMLKELRKNHRIVFLALESNAVYDGWRELALEYCHEVIAVPWAESTKYSWRFFGELAKNTLLSSKPYVIDKYVSSELKKIITKYDKDGYDIMVCDFLAPAANFPKHLKTPTLLFEHNVESDIWRRHYEKRSSNPILKKYFLIQWRRMEAFEKECCGKFDGVVTVSPNDTDTLRSRFNVRNVIGDVPAGVDAQYFCPCDNNLKITPRLIFTGSMDWIPNEDAVGFFLKDIYPRIQTAVPEVQFTIAGRNPSRTLVERATDDPSIHVTGTVDDIRPFVRKSLIMVVPLRIGGGTRIKIFEAMSMGVPIVSTTIGAEGLPVSHGENILLADDQDSFAGEVLRLISNAELRDRIVDSALQMVRKNHTWEAASRVFESYCLKLVNDEKKRRAYE